MLALLLLALVPTTPARAAGTLPVFVGDPVDAGTGLAQPMMPGLPLILPGADKQLGTADDTIDTGLVGDIDLVVRAGNVAAGAMPPPAGVAGGASVVTTVAGGGSTGQGGEAPFTVMLDDSTTSPPYGSAITSTELDARPVAVYAFADLDDDGRIGPTASGTATENALRLQEAASFVGRQVGVFSHGRLQASIGLEAAAPASIGGLRVALVAAAYTGHDSPVLFSDGTMILTRWPFFPPLQVSRVLDLGNPHPPDPSFPSQLEFDPSQNWLPAPSGPVFGTPFALPVDGSEPTTDHVVVVSAPAVAAQFFVPASPGFVARSDKSLHAAPPVAGSGRTLVQVPERIVLTDAAGHVDLRVMPVDLFSNVADLGTPMQVSVQVRGELAITAPDTDASATSEVLALDGATGAVVTIAAAGTDGGRVELLVGGAVVASLPVVVGASVDTDGDGVADDGNASGVAGDHPCDGSVIACDDNCPLVLNPSQLDTDHNGIGDCCDGACTTHPSLVGCNECKSATPPVVGAITAARLRLRTGNGARPDSLTVRLSFTLPDAASDTPDRMSMSLALTQAGKGGYLGDLAAISRNPLRPMPWYDYVDPSGASAGITSARFVRLSETSFRGSLHAAGPSLVDLATGTATLTLYLGGETPFDDDDLVSIALSCSPSIRGLRCRMP